MTIQNNTVDMVKRNSNEFSFVETLDSMINNHEFRDGLQDFYVGKHNKYSFVWEALSAIGQEVGNTIYENVLNYIDLASNVDLCKTKALQSISKSIGVDFSVLKGIDNFPQEIRDMIDVLSINRKYILQTDFLCQKLIDDIAKKAYEDIPDLNKRYIKEQFTTETNTPGYITEEKYYNYLSSLYNDFMVEMVNLPYNTDISAPIWWIEERELIEHETSEDEEIESFKKRNGIKNSFDEKTIVDNIDNCTDKLDNYYGFEKECLEMEIERRSKTLRSSDGGDQFREKYKKGYETKLKTRYSHNRKQKVAQYIDMIQNQYNGLNDIDKITGKYDIDKNFFVIPKTNNFKNLIDIEKARKSKIDYSAVNLGMIGAIANKLSQITVYISKIRDILKIQTQKYYAKGTFNLLAFVINEYLIEFSNSEVFNDVDIIKTNVKANLSAHSFNQIDMIEYFDTTEYFNISCETSNKSNNKKSVNARFWEEEQDINTNSGFAFTDSQISNFYLDEVGLNGQISDINDFLNVVFSFGAHSSYSNSLSSFVITEGETEDITEGNRYLYLSHSGNKYGFSPYANMKNRVHSSFQAHPYLKNFIEYTRNSYPVINAFYNDTISEITEEEAIKKLGEYIGKYGETINIAVNNQYDYSGYKTRYETTPHDGQYDVEGYDGIFFPPAIDDFLNEPNAFIDSVSSMISHDKSGNQTAYGKYYQTLGYTQKCYKYIAEQLSEYKDKIYNIAQYKDNLSDVHDIFKYGTDAFGNMYILLKKYTDYDISFKDKKSTPGQLWIRIKDNPIAFPAFIGNRCAVDTESDFNGNIEYLSQISCTGKNVTDGTNTYSHVMKYDNTDMSYFYDMEFSLDKNTLMLAAYPVNDISTVGADGKYNEMISADYYKDYQHSDILINKIDMWYDNVDERTKLYLESAGIGRYSKEDSYNSMDSEDTRQITGKSFVGFYKNGYAISPVFVEKTYDKNTKTYSVNDKNIGVSLQIWFKNSIEKEYNNLILNFKSSNNNYTGYKTSSGDVEFSNTGDVMTFAFLTKPNQEQISVQTYVGIHDGHGITNYTTQTSGYNIIEDDKGEMNSFDMLNNFVTMIDAQIINGVLVNKSSKTYNLNSDVSYIPVYSGENGYTDISKTNYNTSPTNSFELLGESDNIDQTINLVNPNADSSKDISAILNDFTNGVVWEDYDPQCDNSLKQFVYNQRKDRGSDNGYITWSIDLEDCGFSQKDLHNMSLVMYNKNTNGKNPYFIGDMTDISATSKRAYVSLKDDTGTYQSKQSDHEISSTNNPQLRVTGTYDYLSKKTNSSECNHLNNVNDIQIYSNEKNIVVTFCPEDYQKTYFIPSDTVALILCNPNDLKIFKYYHYLDHRGLVKDGKIDGIYLSSIEFSQYNYLSDVPGLSGHDGLDFKYAEQDVFDISSDFYYFPCFNTAYPFRGVDAFKKSRTTKSDYNIIELDGLFNQNNLFEIKIDKKNIIDEISRLEIPKTFVDNECMIGYEDFSYDSKGNVIYDNTKEIYDVIDPRILQCVEMYDLNDKGTIGKIDVDINPNEETKDVIDRIAQSYNYHTSFLEQTYSDYVFDYESYGISSEDFQGIDKLLNVYVNYKKENDRKITLFFNYYNYINTPFIKFSNGTTTIDTREGTYLKLKSGEDGLLKIELQFKHYDTDGDLYGFTNIVVATYRIFNISDDKPKFIIHKVSGVDKESLIRRYKTPETEIYPESKTIYISKEDKERDTIEFDLNIRVYSNKILKNGKYTVTYQSNELENTDDLSKTLNSIIIEEPKDKTLHFRTRTKFDKLKSYQFSIRNVEIHDEDGQKSKITTYPGQVDMVFTNYLRKESEDTGELVLTENSSENMKIII